MLNEVVKKDYLLTTKKSSYTLNFKNVFYELIFLWTINGIKIFKNVDEKCKIV